MTEEIETQDTPKAGTATANANCNSQLDIPELGIFFKRFHCKKITKFVCAWKNENESHVYELRIRPSEGGGYVAIGQTDGTDTFRLYYQSSNLLVKMAKATMRKYLVTSHRRAWKKFRDAQKAGLCSDVTQPQNTDRVPLRNCDICHDSADAFYRHKAADTQMAILDWLFLPANKEDSK